VAAVVAGDDGNGCENHDERCTSLLSVEEAAVRRLVETLIPEEIIPDQVEEIQIWGDGRCYVHGVEAHKAVLQLYNSVAREPLDETHFGGRPIHEIDQIEVIHALVGY